MSGKRVFLLWIVPAAGIACYAVLIHYFTTHFQQGSLAALLPLAPLALGVGAIAWRSRRRLLLMGIGVVLAAALWFFPVDFIVGANVLYVYLAEHVGINGLLGWVFGRSLFAGREALCTHLAGMVHGSLPLEVIAYTRAVTWAWTGLFAGIVVVSLGLFFFASIDAWSVFANVLNTPLVLLMFVVEYRIRLRALPDFPHVSILEGIRSFRSSGGQAAPDLIHD